MDPQNQAEFSRASAVQQTLKASVTIPASLLSLPSVLLLGPLSTAEGVSGPLLQTLQWLSAPLNKRPHSVYILCICLSHQTLLASSPSAVLSAPSASAVASLLCHELSRSQDLSLCPSFCPQYPFSRYSPGLSSNATFPIRLLVTTLSSSLVVLPSPFPCVLSLNST